jgi:predicted TIM-barrel fold metal-dependent hydrolase
MITDVNVNLSRWPFRRLPYDETARLVRKLKAATVSQAWAGTFDGLLHKDITSANARLAEECKTEGAGFLVPFGSVNITVPDWQEDVRRCHEEFKMPGIRIHPGYHGYELKDPRFAELLAECDKRNLILQIAFKMEDERTQHQLLRIAQVNGAPLTELLPKFPKLRVVILNGAGGARRLATLPNVWFDIAMVEGVAGVSTLIKSVPHQRVLFGSHFPFYYYEAAALKMQESELGETITQAIFHGNAAKLLKPT